MSVIDLGCGTGEITRMLADALPDPVTRGIDSSKEMLDRARRVNDPRIEFELASIEACFTDDRRYDLVFSNAALHWLDDHERLIGHLAAMLHQGGQLAVQMPSNHHHYTQTLLQDIASTPPFAAALGGWVRLSPVLDSSRYAELLFEAGLSSITVFEKIYPHVLPDAEALFDWISGTTLLPYLDRLPNELHASFTATYRSALRQRTPERPVFFPFRRLFLSAARWDQS